MTSLPDGVSVKDCSFSQERYHSVDYDRLLVRVVNKNSQYKLYTPRGDELNVLSDKKPWTIQ